MRAAETIAKSFAHGAVCVALAPIADPTLVLGTIARTLGLRETGDTPLADDMRAHLRMREVLLVLDNFEHVLSAAPLIARIVGDAPRVKLLATSRASLRVYGEHEYAVAPLGLPDASRLLDIENVAESPAVQLFVDRARAVDSGLSLTEENAGAIAAICRRLDGLPLAIELAAARCKIFTPHALLQRLSSPYDLLTDGAKDLLERQQALRRAVDWSYNLLTLEEQRWFARLAVFAGGCTIDAIRAVCFDHAASEIPVLDGMVALVDRNLVQRETGIEAQPRFTMLETLRQYAHERLSASDGTTAMQRKHASFYLEFVQDAQTRTHGAEQLTWFKKLEEERDNIRTALAWSLGDSGDRSIGFQMIGALWWFWAVRGHISEGRRWAELFLAVTDAPGSPARANVLCAAGTLAMQQGDHEVARRRLEECRALCRAIGYQRGYALASVILGMLMIDRGDRAESRPLLDEGVDVFRAIADRWGIAFGLYGLGDALVMSDPLAARAAYAESLGLYRIIGDKQGISLALTSMGRLDLMTGDYSSAERLFGEGLSLRRELGDTWLIAISLIGLAGVARCRGDAERADGLLGEALAIQRELGNKHGIAWVLQNMGEVAICLGEVARAGHLLEEALRLRQEQKHSLGIGLCLLGFAGIAQASDRSELAARLLGAADLDHSSSDIDPADRLTYRQALDDVRAAVGPTAFQASWQLGKTLSLEEACSVARAEAILASAREPKSR
jgi:predicted ATPase